MSDTSQPDDPVTERRPPGDTVQEDPLLPGVDDSDEESERVKRRLEAAIVIPLVALVVLISFVIAVSRVLLEVEHFGGLAAPLFAGLVAAAILVTAWRGWLTHDPRMPFGRLLGGILIVGVVLLGGAVLALVLGSDGGADVPEGTIAVTALEYEFEAESLSAPEGEVTITYESGGQIGHTLTIEGYESDLLLKVTPAAPLDTGTIQLEEGVYILYCDLKGHRELGMETTIEITDAPESAG